jgi:hypothetical protein
LALGGALLDHSHVISPCDTIMNVLEAGGYVGVHSSGGPNCQIGSRDSDMGSELAHHLEFKSDGLDKLSTWANSTSTWWSLVSSLQVVWTLVDTFLIRMEDDGLWGLRLCRIHSLSIVKTIFLTVENTSMCPRKYFTVASILSHRAAASMQGME